MQPQQDVGVERAAALFGKAEKAEAAAKKRGKKVSNRFSDGHH
jgi:hypothetical protein